jgi:hypothetical protein
MKREKKKFKDEEIGGLDTCFHSMIAFRLAKNNSDGIGYFFFKLLSVIATYVGKRTGQCMGMSSMYLMFLWP